MYKMILNDKTEIKIAEVIGIGNIKIKNKTIDELESILTESNLSNVIFKKDNDIIGKYNNLTLINLSKNYITKEITINLQ